MSCRVIGRTVETAMLAQVCRAAESLGCTSIRGTYIPTTKNAMVADIYAKFGFELVDRSEGCTTWQYDLTNKGNLTNEFIRTVPCFTSKDGSTPDSVSA